MPDPKPGQPAPAATPAPKIILEDDWKKRADPAPSKPASSPAPASGGLVVDSDWKNQAQAEKERLAAQAESKAKETKKPAAPGAGGQREMPPADFQSLVGTLVTQALLYMGGFPDPRTGRAVVALDYARFHIDLLAVLADKTKGNLAAEEAEDINQALSELRIRYVEIVKAVEEMAARGELGQASPGGGGGLGGGGGGGGGGAGGFGGPAGPGGLRF